MMPQTTQRTMCTGLAALAVLAARALPSLSWIEEQMPAKRKASWRSCSAPISPCPPTCETWCPAQGIQVLCLPNKRGPVHGLSCNICNHVAF
ncbi:unnamed protein product [Symbiodinium sp. CCMP2592]|nr:unnamed protein product [Symbiodinium sp. CCMP2592]